MAKAFVVCPPTDAQLKEAEMMSGKLFKSRECELCGTMFRHGAHNSRVCKLCTIEASCSYCGKSFVTDWDSFYSRYRERLVESVQSRSFDMPLYCSNTCGGKSVKLTT